MLRYRAISFDLDNTLYDEDEYRTGAYRYLAKLISRDLGITAGDAFRALTSSYERNTDSTVFQDTLATLGVPIALINDYVHQVMVPAYRSWSGPITPYPWVRPLLERLRSSGIKLGLITNGGSHTQWNKIRLLNLEHDFDEIVVTGDHFPRALWKPHTAPFELCFQRLSGTYEGCLYIGDDSVRDVVGPKSLGIHVVLVGQPGTPLSDIHSLQAKQIIDYLSSLLS